MSELFKAATRLLARREHGAHELAVKLMKKGHAECDVQAVIQECQKLNLQCDKRFAESICRTRISQGYGPLKIQQELTQGHIAKEIIADILKQEEGNWLKYAREAHKSKFSEQKANGMDMRQKQKQFLLYRGFPMDIIIKIFNRDYIDEVVSV